MRDINIFFRTIETEDPSIDHWERFLLVPVKKWNSFVKEVTSAYAIFQPNKTNNKGGGKKRERVQDREFITQ